MTRRRRSAFTPARLRTLLAMHEYCRPMGSQTEQRFINRFIAVLPNAERDPHGNWHVTVSDDPILWSCHTDTVHWKEGKQQLRYSRKTGLLTLAKNETASCLGADCTAGVFLMVEMIKAKVPGHYVFHYGEERGCVGSGRLAQDNADFLRQFTYAIALDRGGTTDIITHQTFGRTASDAFAWSLADQLGGWYEPSSGGIYTDTNEYAALIAECSNVSVGYTAAHTRHETLDTRHLFTLLGRLLALDVSALVADRDLSKLDDEDDDEILYDDDRDIIKADWVRRDAQDDEWDARSYLDPIHAEVQRELVKELKLERLLRNEHSYDASSYDGSAIPGTPAWFLKNR
jgi:hypothetical protein